MPKFNIIVPAMTGPDYLANDIIAIDSVEAQRIALSVAKKTISGFVKKGSCVIEEIKEVDGVLVQDAMQLPAAVPSDFYSNPAFSEQIEKAISLSSDLKYPLDFIGEKAMNSDVSAINRYAKGIDKIAAAIYKANTDTANANRSKTKLQVKALETNSANIKNQFTELWAQRLREIKDAITAALTAKREESGITQKFMKPADDAIIPLVKLTGAVTDTGALTKKVRDFINTLVAGELQQMMTVKNRELVISNESLLQGIPPLSPEYLGDALYGTDETFRAKLDALIVVERQRIVDADARAAEKLAREEAAKAKKVDKALESVVTVSVNPSPITQQEIDTMRRKSEDAKYDARNPSVLPKPIDARRTVRVTLMFDIPDVKNTSSNAAVEEVYTREVLKLLPESLKVRFKGASASDV
jgi:hypothetical protein